MQIIQVLSLCLLLGATSYVNSFDICAAGQIFSAAQLALTPGCSGCGSYLQCVGNRNAVTNCSLISQTDANATALIISNGAGWASYVAAYLNITADTTAAAFGQNGGNCKTQYGSSSTCTVAALSPPPGPPGPHHRQAGRRPGPPPPGPRPPKPSTSCRVSPNFL